MRRTRSCLSVRPHTLAVLADLDGRGLRNHVLVITRHQMKPGDAERLNQLVNLKVTLLFTYSGIDDKRIEPYPSAGRGRLAEAHERPRRAAGTGPSCTGVRWCLA